VWWPNSRSILAAINTMEPMIKVRMLLKLQKKSEKAVRIKHSLKNNKSLIKEMTIYFQALSSSKTTRI
jgi:hypothetical protein